MILSDRDIKKAIKSKKLLIEPLEQTQIGPCGIDIRLGYEIREFKRNLFKEYFNPYELISPDEYTAISKPKNGKFILEPGDFILATSLEKIKLPSNITARLEGRSSIGRLGIIIYATQGHIDPGFEGTLTLKISNISAMPIALYPEMKIAQIVFEKLSSSVQIPYEKRKTSKYIKQKGVQVSKIYTEKEK